MDRPSDSQSRSGVDPVLSGGLAASPPLSHNTTVYQTQCQQHPDQFIFEGGVWKVRPPSAELLRHMGTLYPDVTRQDEDDIKRALKGCVLDNQAVPRRVADVFHKCTGTTLHDFANDTMLGWTRKRQGVWGPRGAASSSSRVD